LLLLGWLFAVVSQTTCASNGLQPLSDGDREAVAGYFTADADGFYGSLQETYHALRALEILERSNVESQKICDSLVGLVQAPHDSVEDAFHVVRIAEVLQCPHGAEVAKVIVPSLQAAVEKAKSLLELHYSVATSDYQGTMILIFCFPVGKKL
jgi:hypothetical protein